MSFLSNIWNKAKSWLNGAPTGNNTSGLADISSGIKIGEKNISGLTAMPIFGNQNTVIKNSSTAASTPVSAIPQSTSVGFFPKESIKTASSSAGQVTYATGSPANYTAPKDPTLIAPQPRTVNPYTSTGGQSINYDSPNYGSGSGTQSYGSGSAYNTYQPPTSSYIPPTIIGPMPGTTGISGTGGYTPSGMGSVSGQQGSGGSNYTGTLSGTSGLSTPSMSPDSYSSTEEEQRRREQGQGNQPPAFIPMNNPYQVPQGFQQTQTPQGGSAFKDAAGNTYVRTSNGLELKSSLPGQLGTQSIDGKTYINPMGVTEVNLAVNPLATKSAFKAKVPQGSIDLGATQKRVSEISKLLSSGGINAADAGTFYNELQNLHASLVQAKLAQNPMLQEGFVQDTPEQDAFINQFPEQEKGSIRSMMDATRTKLGLPQIEADLAKVQTQLQTYEELQAEVFKELMENPEMPAGLKQKRLDDFNRRNSLAIQNLQGKLKILEQKKAYANEALDREFNIAQLEENQNERARNYALNQLQLFISSGGIANFSEEALQQAAMASGLPVEQLRSIKQAVSSKNTGYDNVQWVQDGKGGITAVGIDKNGKPVQIGQFSDVAPVKTTGDLDYKTATRVDAIKDQFVNNEIVKKYNQVQEKAISVQNIVDSGVGGPTDLALVYEFMKALDPTSVVRETEYSTAAKSGNIFAGIFSKYNGYFKEQGGFLPDNVKQGFLDLVNIKYDAVSKQYSNWFNESARLIDRATGQQDGADYLPNFGAVTDNGATSGSSSGGQTVSFNGWADF